MIKSLIKGKALQALQGLINQGVKDTDNPTFAQVSLSNTPTASNHVATKSYIDSIIENAKRKENCEVATTGNTTLSGEQTIDGVLTSSSRVLVWQQTNQIENGIYVSNSGDWTRSEDASSGAEIRMALIGVAQGSIYGGRQFNNSNSIIPTIGVDNITFVPMVSSLPVASSSQNGVLSSTDWTAFNNKSNAIENVASSTIKTSGGLYFPTSFANLDTTDYKIDLPSAGTYMIFGCFRGLHDGDAATFGKVKLYNNTDTADVPNSVRMFFEIANTNHGLVNASISLIWLITVNGAKTIYLQGEAFPSANTVGIQCDSNGYNEFGYVRLA